MDADSIAAEVAKLTLGPDDFALVRIDDYITADRARDFAERLRAMIDGRRVIVLTGRVEISTLPREELERLLRDALQSTASAES